MYFWCIFFPQSKYLQKYPSPSSPAGCVNVLRALCRQQFVAGADREPLTPHDDSPKLETSSHSNLLTLCRIFIAGQRVAGKARTQVLFHCIRHLQGELVFVERSRESNFREPQLPTVAVRMIRGSTMCDGKIEM